MGSSQSIVVDPTVAVLVIAGVAAAGYSLATNSASTPSSTKEEAAASTKKGKKKKGTAMEPVDDAPAVAQHQQPEPRVVAFPAVIPGGFDAGSTADLADSAVSSSSSKKPKKKKAKTLAAAPSPKAEVPAAPVAAAVPTPKSKSKRQSKSLASSAVDDTDSSWTRVKASASNKKRPADNAGAGDSEQLSSATGLSSALSSDAGTSSEAEAPAPVVKEDNKRTLAEKLLPKPRKTAVDDMLEKPDYPEIARVMRVAPRADEKPVDGYSWEDYEDVSSSTRGNDADAEEDGGLWESVKPKGRAKLPLSASSSSARPSSMASSGELTKKQRQNANKREATKSAKDVGEADRLATLARHKRELEKAKIAEQFGGKSKAKQPSSASVDANGKLVWD